MVSSEELKYCSKTCFKKIESFAKRHEHSSLNWNEDAINPDKNGTESSIAVLLQWWCTEGNWARYRGKGNDGAKKIHHCQGIADIINKTVIFPRNAKGVRCKVDKIHEKFKQAHYFVNSQTGAGIREKDGPISFKTKVIEICEHYYDLEAIMSDRAATMPSITSDSHFFDLTSSGIEDGLMATEQNFVAINSSSDALDGESKKCESDSDDEDKKKPPMRSKQPLPRRSESDGDIFPTKRPRSSPLTVNPSNSGVIGGRYVSKKKSDDDIMEEIGKLNDTTFWRIKHQERHNKVVEKNIRGVRHVQGNCLERK